MGLYRDFGDGLTHVSIVVHDLPHGKPALQQVVTVKRRAPTDFGSWLLLMPHCLDHLVEKHERCSNQYSSPFSFAWSSSRPCRSPTQTVRRRLLLAHICARLYPTQPACEQQDKQHEENEPAKTSPYQRAACVKPAAADQQQKDQQDNYDIHSALLSDFRRWVIPRPIDCNDIAHSLGWLFEIAHDPLSQAKRMPP